MSIEQELKAKLRRQVGATYLIVKAALVGFHVIQPDLAEIGMWAMLAAAWTLLKME